MYWRDEAMGLIYSRTVRTAKSLHDLPEMKVVEGPASSLVLPDRNSIAVLWLSEPSYSAGRSQTKPIVSHACHTSINFNPNE